MEQEMASAEKWLAKLDDNSHPVELEDMDSGFNCISWSVGSRNTWDWGDWHIDSDDEPWAAYNRFLSWYLSMGYEIVDKTSAFDPTRHYVALLGADERDEDYYGYDEDDERTDYEPTHAIRYDPVHGWTSKNGGYQLYKGTSPQAVQFEEHYGRFLEVLVAPIGWGGKTAVDVGNYQPISMW